MKPSLRPPCVNLLARILVSVVFILCATAQTFATVTLNLHPLLQGRLPSDKYSCSVSADGGTTWLPADVYKSAAAPSNDDDGATMTRPGVYPTEAGLTASFSSFDFTGGSVMVKVTKLTGAISQCVIRPTSSGITPSVSGSTATFTITNPGQYVTEMDYTPNDSDANGGGPIDSMIIFANPPLSIPAPDPNGARVIKVTPGIPPVIPADPTTWDAMYFMPGIHDLSDVNGDPALLLQDGHSYYLAPGAWVRGFMSNRQRPAPANEEAESMSPAISGGTDATTSVTGASGGQIEYFYPPGAGAVGSTMTLTTPSLPAGTYQVSFRYFQAQVRGTHTVSIDGTVVSGTIDQSIASGNGFRTIDLNSVVFATAGTHSIVLTCTGTGAHAPTGSHAITSDSFVFQRITPETTSGLNPSLSSHFVTIYGYGVLSGENIVWADPLTDTTGGHFGQCGITVLTPFATDPNPGLLQNVTIEGITIHDCPLLSCVLSVDSTSSSTVTNLKEINWRENTSGVHLYGTGIVQNCFFHTEDDDIVDATSHAQYRNNLHWKNYSTGGMIYKSFAEYDGYTVSDGDQVLYFRHAGDTVPASVFDLKGTYGATGRIFRNMKVEDTDMIGGLIQLYGSIPSGAPAGPIMANVRLENIQLPAIKAPGTNFYIHNWLAGVDSSHPLSNVNFVNCTIGGVGGAPGTALTSDTQLYWLNANASAAATTAAQETPLNMYLDPVACCVRDIRFISNDTVTEVLNPSVTGDVLHIHKIGSGTGKVTNNSSVVADTYLTDIEIPWSSVGTLSYGLDTGSDFIGWEINGVAVANLSTLAANDTLGAIFQPNGTTPAEPPAPPATPSSGATPTRPASPTGLTAAAGTSRVLLTWPNQTGYAYKVGRSTTAGGPYTIIANGQMAGGQTVSSTSRFPALFEYSSTDTTLSYQDTGVTDGTTYYYVISAVVSELESLAPSSEVSATPLATAVTTTVEAETAPLIHVTAGALDSVLTVSGASGGQLVDFTPSTVHASNSSITFTTPIVPSGTFQVSLNYWAAQARGTCVVIIDKTQLGGTIDQSIASGTAFAATTLGTVTFAVPGKHTIEVLYKGPGTYSSGGASGFDLMVDSFGFLFQTGSAPTTTTAEAESMSPTVSAGTDSITTVSGASGGQLVYFYPPSGAAVGATLTVTTPSLPAGSYLVTFRYQQASARGAHVVAIDGTQLGDEIDQSIASGTNFQSETLGTVTFIDAGVHTITLWCDGPGVYASGATTLSADSFIFTPQ